jgi:hypothetical protein
MGECHTKVGNDGKCSDGEDDGKWIDCCQERSGLQHECQRSHSEEQPRPDHNSGDGGDESAALSDPEPHRQDNAGANQRHARQAAL